MIDREPMISVGIIEGLRTVEGEFLGPYALNDSVSVQGPFRIDALEDGMTFSDERGMKLPRQKEIRCTPLDDSPFVLHDVIIGLQFHWQRKENQSFRGTLRIVFREEGTLTAINEIGVEEYLRSVISSEMSANAPLELLKAHAMTSRSWLGAMLAREQRNVGVPSQRSRVDDDEILRWYDREDHAQFDVCADDHCQRYQGVSKIISPAASEAVDATRGMFLVYNDEICDARFSKACGGLSEPFENVWEERNVPYLTCISDSDCEHSAITTEREAERWILGSPSAYCNTADGRILNQVLPSFDRETTDFFRWKVEYTCDEIGELVKAKSGIDFGTILNLEPVQRGPSGRIIRLRIQGTRKTVVVGKELEIRRWLSASHLYSSAFVVKIERDKEGVPEKFTLFGAGWGHGVGLCQIGAAVMATKGFKAEQIVKHYFRGAELKKIY